jgi:hypothetical protein
MAIVYPYSLRCECGHTFVANLADGVNAGRSPEVRDEIIQGAFHRVTCPSCRKTVTAEKSFFYSDAPRGTFIQVKPRQDRHLWRQASAGLEKTAALIPESHAPLNKRKIRVVFGMQELREKLIAENLGIDDRMLELVKVIAVHDHPFLLHRPRLRLSIEGHDRSELQLKAAFDHSSQAFMLSLPLDRVKRLAGRKALLRSWISKAGHQHSILELRDDKWANMWRWSPQPDALDLLRAYAQQVQLGQSIDPAAPEFTRMLNGLPRGSHLPIWAKVDLQVLFNEFKRVGNEAMQLQLFEIRFAKGLEDDWATNGDKTDIDTLWQLLMNLPPNDVEGNTSIAEIYLDKDAGGGFYEPQTGDIHIGERALSNKEQFEDVVRHEIGHGVHEKNSSLVDTWLKDRFGWRMFDPDRRGVDAWVELMGGWARFGASAAEQQDMPRLLSAALGGGSSWFPPAPPTVPPGHVWSRPDFGPRLAFKQSGDNWYRNNANWYRANGKAFFCNFWYRGLCVVDEATLGLIARMPSSYASMSPLEFFAELYALYHDVDDPKWPVIPADVVEWLKSNTGAPTPSPAMAAQPEATEDWRGTIRPD